MLNSSVLAGLIRPLTALLAILLLSVSVAGCGGLSDAEKAAAAEKKANAAAATGYFEALGTDDPAQMKKALEFAKPGSNAAAYATYLTATTQAGQDGGQPLAQNTVKPITGGYALCQELEAGKTAKGEDCSQYTAIKYEAGKLVSFSPGGTTEARPLDDRIILGKASAKPLGSVADVKFVAAYESISGALVVVLEMEAKKDFSISNATYIAGGRQTATAGVGGPTELKSGVTAGLSANFQGAHLGGKVTVDAYDSNYDKISVEFEVK